MKKIVLSIILCLSLLLSAGQASTVRAQDPPEDLSFPEYPQDILENHFEDLSHRMFGEDMPEDWHHNHHFEEPIEREFVPPTEESLRLTQEQVQSFDCATVTDVPQSECEALVALYESTNGAGWTDNTNWLTTTTVGDWKGVTVSGGHVTKISLGWNQLTGNIPIELGQLSNLEWLFLYNNQLSGNIPSQLGQLNAIQYFSLAQNQISGTIPIELSQLIALTDLHLAYNQLTGIIPPELGQLNDLKTLTLDGNQLSGTIPIELGQLSALEGFYLNDNQLTGNIPPELGQLSVLKFLRLGNNQLNGSIPRELGQLSALEIIHLNNNQLSGNIPHELGQLNVLHSLNFNSNQLTGNIPPELGQLSKLRWLQLQSNQLSGNIPHQLGQLTAFVNLNLSQNQLSGTIPPELGQATSLLQVNLSQNQLEGNVPANFANLVNLCVEGDEEAPCYGLYKTDLGYNLLNVPQPNPPSDFLFAKDPDWDQTQGIKKVISGPVGGVLNSNDENTTIDIPKNAVNGDVTFTLKPMIKPNGIPAPYMAFGNNFELSALDANGPVTTFNLPLNFTLRYTDAAIGAIPEDTLKLYYYNESASTWQDAITTCSDGDYFYNPEENWFSLPVCHLSDFTVVGEGVFIQFPLILRK